MHFSFFVVSALVASCGAIPATLPYIPHDIISPPKLPASHIPGLYPVLFPTAKIVGTFVGPTLKVLIGERLLERLDDTADLFCVATGHDPSGHGGICQNILDAVYKLIVAHNPVLQAKAFKALAYTLCIAPNTQPPLGTCQAILELADCVANRMLQVKDVECTPEKEPGDGDDDGDDGDGKMKL